MAGSCPASGVNWVPLVTQCKEFLNVSSNAKPTAADRWPQTWWASLVGILSIAQRYRCFFFCFSVFLLLRIIS